MHRESRHYWLFVNKKVQLDATICRHLFTAKSLYMFRASQQKKKLLVMFWTSGWYRLLDDSGDPGKRSPVCDSRHDNDIFLSSKNSDRLRNPHNLIANGASKILSPALKWPELQGDYSPTSNAAIRVLSLYVFVTWQGHTPVHQTTVN